MCDGLVTQYRGSRKSSSATRIVGTCQSNTQPLRRVILLTAINRVIEDDGSMQEVLSHANESETPFKEREYYELRLDDLFTPGRMRFSVRQSRAFWSEIDRSIVWEYDGVEILDTLDEAQERYKVLRSALSEKGFTESDMDFL